MFTILPIMLLSNAQNKLPIMVNIIPNSSYTILNLLLLMITLAIVMFKPIVLYITYAMLQYSYILHYIIMFNIMVMRKHVPHFVPS